MYSALGMEVRATRAQGGAQVYRHGAVQRPFLGLKLVPGDFSGIERTFLSGTILVGPFF